MSRQAVHGWLGRYEREGPAGLPDHSRRPHYQPRQLDAETEALICRMHGSHPRWGPRRLLFELGKAKVTPLPSRSTVYRVLVRHGLVPARTRKRRRQDYKRWQREEPIHSMTLQTPDRRLLHFAATPRSTSAGFVIVTGHGPAVELRGLEPLAFWMQTRRSSS